MLQITEEQIQEIITNAKEQLQESIVKDTKSSIDWYVKRALEEELCEFIKEYVKTEIAPEVRAYIAGEKSTIIKAVADASTELGGALAAAMAKRAAENLGTSYKQKQIWEALFS